MLAKKALELLLPSGDIEFDLSRCLHRRFSRSSCQKCVQACPTGALSIGKGPCHNPALCTGCRRCEGACPTGAPRGDARDLGDLAAVLAEHPRPVLGCRAPAVEAHVHTGCLGFLEVEGLLALSLFFPDGLTLNLSRCEDCRNANMLLSMLEALCQVQQLVGSEGAKRLQLARSSAEVGYREGILSRRQFFDFLRKKSAETISLAAARLQNAPDSLAGGHKHLPARRRLLLRALRYASPELRDRLEKNLFPSVSFRPTCTGCTGCAGICPTGSLSSTEDEPPRPQFTASLCTGCSLCAEFCRKKGLSFAATTDSILSHQAQDPFCTP